jgi:myosin heavy subunit
LLEKNRVIFQLEGESNFHVFYLLFLSELQNKSGALQSLLREDIDYRYIYPSERLNDQDDRAFLHQRIPLLISALEAIGINSSLQNHLFQVLAGILLLGNVEFKPVSGSFKKGMNLDDVECCVDESDPLLTAIAMLLGKEDIANVFTAKVIQGRPLSLSTS